MIMEFTIEPFATLLGSIFFTFPDTELTTLADMNPPASAMICPTSTSSPTATKGFAGAPICWLNGNTISTPLGCSTVIGCSIESSLPSYGCTPPINVANPIFFSSSIRVNKCKKSGSNLCKASQINCQFSDYFKAIYNLLTHK